MAKTFVLARCHLSKVAENIHSEKYSAAQIVAAFCSKKYSFIQMEDVFRSKKNIQLFLHSLDAAICLKNII